MLASLRDAGPALEAVTKVVFTHAHSDHHLGAVTAASPVFANATCSIGENELALWTQPGLADMMPRDLVLMVIWIDACPNQLYAALTFMGGAVWRQRLTEALGDQGDVSALIGRHSDAELADLMENLGGNCVETMAGTFAATLHDRPTCFLAYTIKGWGTPSAGHKDNHGGLMNNAQMADWQGHMGVPEGQEWEPFATVRDPAALQGFLSGVPSSPKAHGGFPTPCCRCPPSAWSANERPPRRWPSARSSMTCPKATVRWRSALSPPRLT